MAGIVTATGRCLEAVEFPDKKRAARRRPFSEPDSTETYRFENWKLRRALARPYFFNYGDKLRRTNYGDTNYGDSILNYRLLISKLSP